MDQEKRTLERSSAGILKLIEVMKKLRDPENGCPWDRIQTHQTLMPFIMEECAEFLDAASIEDDENMREELGDVLMQIVLHSVIAEEREKFTFADVVEDISRKMISRHPHVFGNGEVKVEKADDVLKVWEKVKAKEKNHAPDPSKSLLDGVPLHAPALLQAEKLQKKAAKVGFDWSCAEDVLAKVGEEYEELKEAFAKGDEEHIDEEIGDLLFAVANLTRFRKRQSGEMLLAQASAKFKRRFQYVEKRLAEQGKSWEEFTPAQLDLFWEEVKKAAPEK